MRAVRLLLGMVIAAGAGCVTYERGTLAAASVAPLPIAMTVISEDAEGKACSDLFGDPVARAIDDAVRSSPGANALVDVTYRFEKLCLVVRGTAVQTF